MKFHRLINIFIATATLAALSTSCKDYSDYLGLEEVTDDDTAVGYFLNISVSVSKGSTVTTRGIPLGGENGDGREAGFQRENAVHGISLFFYQESALDLGINSAGTTKILAEAYYPLTPTYTKRENDNDVPVGEADINGLTRPGDTADEAVFSTGDQPLPKNILPGIKYNVIALLNIRLTGFVGENLSKLRDYEYKLPLFTGDDALDIQSCTDFVMSSEQDFVMLLPNATNLDWQVNQTANTTTYTSLKPLRAERLSARLDFHAIGSTYVNNKTYGTTTTKLTGYEYNVDGSSTDKFIVTAVTPFNLNGAANGEFLIKRLTNNFGTPVNEYLVDETPSTSLVLDPLTLSGGKSSNMISSLKLLESTTPEETDLQHSFAIVSPYYHTIASIYGNLHEAADDNKTAGWKGTTAAPGDVLILAYPRENTLNLSENLYANATGLAIEGYYYSNSANTVTQLIYYGFLRHQGEASTSYKAWPASTNLSDLKALTNHSSLPMNFSVVRNNIYRVSIDKINNKASSPELSIMVKKWDPYFHAFIYI